MSENVKYFTFLGMQIGVHRNDDPSDVDEAYGEGTYASLFPEDEEDEVQA